MEWQVKQARDIIRLYMYDLKRSPSKSGPIDIYIRQQWKTAATAMLNILRFRQLSLQTKRTYVQWLHGKIALSDRQLPCCRSSIKLGVDRRVAPLTQNHALNALLLVQGAVRAKRTIRPPAARMHRKKFDHYWGLLMVFSCYWPRSFLVSA